MVSVHQWGKARDRANSADGNRERKTCHQQADSHGAKRVANFCFLRSSCCLIVAVLFLSANFMQTEKIYHYTSIESLAMILSTKKLRFSRLDGVDDVTEAQTHHGIPFGKYFFVSCWTQEEEDNLAQWKMYGGDMAGIRIELPIYPFKNILMGSHNGLEAHGQVFSPLGTNDLFGHDYMILPPVLGSTWFKGPVEYVDDVAARYNSAITVVNDANGTDSIVIKEFYDLARLKSKTWQFQAEYRFLLHVLPIIPPFPKNVPFTPTGEQYTNCGPAFRSGVDLGISYIDVAIDPAVLAKMVIRTGPLCTAGGRVCVEALLNAYASKAKIESSPLAGTVRRKG
jgi:hypothetical protein